MSRMRIVLNRRLLIVLLLGIFTIVQLQPNVLYALGGTYFDDDGTTSANCDIGDRGYLSSSYTTPDCTSTIAHKTRLTVGQSSAVPFSYASLQASFATGSSAPPAGQSITIYGLDLCPTSTADRESRDMLNNGYYASNPGQLNGGTPITHYRIGAQAVNGVYRANASNCRASYTINLGAGDFQQLAGVPGVWVVSITAQHCEKYEGSFISGCTLASPTPLGCNGSTAIGRCDGIKNGFQLSASGGIISTKAGGGLCTTDDGKCTTIQTATGSHGDYGRYLTYIARFGSDCTVPAAGKAASVSFYDLDYPGGDGVIKMTIHDQTTNQWLWKDPGGNRSFSSNWQATRPSYAQAEQPFNADALPSRWGFTAQRNHNYELYIINVSPGLVMQFGTPFDGAFYTVDCPTASVSPSPRIVNGAGVTPAYFEEGDSYTSQGNLVNSSTAVGSVNASWQTWYDDTDMLANGIGETGIYSHGNNVVAVPGSGTVTALGAGTASADNTRPAGVPGTISGGHRYICSRVFGVSSADGVTIVPSSERTSCIPIQRRPYFQVTHGDTNASATLASTGCATNTTSTISAFNKGNVPTFTGSGTGVAAFAAGSITEFTSGSKPKGLTFSNIAGAGDPTYGGGFRNTYCIPDYWGNAPAIDNSNVNSATGTLVTNGDVFISESSINTGGLTFGIDNIQLRWIIAKNIYISSSVGYLEGNYIAKEKIYTCATGLRTIVPMSSMVSNCGTSLTVNGTFIAGGGVKLQRTFGSLNSSPAETFVYSPELWIQAILPNSSVPSSAKGSIGKYDSITLLPPVL